MRRAAALLIATALWLPTAAWADEDDDLIAAQCPAAAAFLQQQDAARAEATDAGLPTRPDLRDDLLAMKRADQDARDAWAAADDAEGPARHLEEVARSNLEQLRRIVDDSGFPTRAMVGADALDAAWLLVQHADADPAFQARMLDLIKDRVEAGELRPSRLALLTDKVLVAQGKPQRFGTHYRVVDGQPKLDPLQDAAGVERRRKAMGLMPLADYRCMLKALYSR